MRPVKVKRPMFMPTKTLQITTTKAPKWEQICWGLRCASTRFTFFWNVPHWCHHRKNIDQASTLCATGNVYWKGVYFVLFNDACLRKDIRRHIRAILTSSYLLRLLLLHIIITFTITFTGKVVDKQAQNCKQHPWMEEEQEENGTFEFENNEKTTSLCLCWVR